MNLWQSFALFVPLCFVICVVTSALHRESLQDALRQAAISTLKLTGIVVLGCAVVYLVMEWILGY